MNVITHNQEEHFIKIESDNDEMNYKIGYNNKMVDQLNNYIVRLYQEMETIIIKVSMNISSSLDEVKDLLPKHEVKSIREK
jgi:hypothetical protein